MQKSVAPTFYEQQMIEKKQNFQQSRNVGDRSLSQNPEVLPLTGKSRWSRFSKFSPVSREKFRQLSLQGKAPQPERMGVRCTFYDNQELHKWLADPANYQTQIQCETRVVASPMVTGGKSWL